MKTTQKGEFENAPLLLNLVAVIVVSDAVGILGLVSPSQRESLLVLSGAGSVGDGLSSCHLVQTIRKGRGERR